VEKYWEVLKMAGTKESVSFEIQEDLIKMLEHISEEYNLRDSNKALRCILDYVASDGDWDDIFSKRRCLRCGSKNGWEKPSS
tara:strand:- start:541 stop:786 length:246 start_codon:yes stop_codon:yes gene_type:complete